MASGKAPAAEQPRDAAAGDFDPIYEWLDDGGSYLLRLSLAGFKKEDFRVHVDAGGRLTVIGQGAGAGRLHKAFQLPNTANLDAITGRFDGAVLTLTVPKLRQPDADAVAAATPPAQQAKEEEAAGEPKSLQEDKTRRQAEEEEADKRLKAEAAREKADAARRDQDEKARAAEHRASVEREAARAKVAEAKAAAERTGGQWKERAAAEGLKLAETIGKNKEVVAAAVAAFTLGAFLSHRLFSRS